VDDDKQVGDVKNDRPDLLEPQPEAEAELDLPLRHLPIAKGYADLTPAAEVPV
jgi:hypothetical protein